MDLICNFIGGYTKLYYKKIEKLIREKVINLAQKLLFEDC